MKDGAEEGKKKELREHFCGTYSGPGNEERTCRTQNTSHKVCDNNSQQMNTWGPCFVQSPWLGLGADEDQISKQSKPSIWGVNVNQQDKLRLRKACRKGVKM